MPVLARCQRGLSSTDVELSGTFSALRHFECLQTIGGKTECTNSISRMISSAIGCLSCVFNLVWNEIWFIHYCASITVASLPRMPGMRVSYVNARACLTTHTRWHRECESATKSGGLANKCGGNSVRAPRFGSKYFSEWPRSGGARGQKEQVSYTCRGLRRTHFAIFCQLRLTHYPNATSGAEIQTHIRIHTSQNVCI